MSKNPIFFFEMIDIKDIISGCLNTPTDEKVNMIIEKIASYIFTEIIAIQPRIKKLIVKAASMLWYEKPVLAIELTKDVTINLRQPYELTINEKPIAISLRQLDAKGNPITPLNIN